MLFSCLCSGIGNVNGNYAYLDCWNTKNGSPLFVVGTQSYLSFGCLSNQRVMDTVSCFFKKSGLQGVRLESLGLVDNAVRDEARHDDIDVWKRRDLRFGPEHDILSDVGFCNMVYQVLNLMAGAALWAAPVCSTWVFIYSGKNLIAFSFGPQMAHTMVGHIKLRIL